MLILPVVVYGVIHMRNTHDRVNRRAVKVWEKRDYANLDDSVELGTRNIKVALKRLRRWARDGAVEELDLDGTIRATAERFRERFEPGDVRGLLVAGAGQ